MAPTAVSVGFASGRPSPTTEPSTVELTGSQVGKDAAGKRYAFYTIVVRWSPPNDRVIHLVRRYRQFSALHTQLLQQHPAAMKQLAVSLPPKELFGTLSVHSRERRRIGLEAYLRALTGIPELMQSAPALMFFNPEYNELGRESANPNASRDLTDLVFGSS